jgi:rhombotail lipoprotein
MRLGLLLCVTAISSLLAGCELLAPSCALGCPSAHSASSSLVDFLYPKGGPPPPQNSIPELHVPLRVGLAFLPPRPGGSAPSAVLREQLLERVRQHFSDRAFVSEIVIIPDYYLESARGFEGLQGVQRLYAVDVVALVSYDQLTHDDKNEWSLGYWSIVGAYVLKGDRYDVSTLIDLAVVDPATHSLVLRAGGVDTRHGNATLLAVQRDSRDASATSFVAASGEMITHLDGALTDFQAAVRAGHANVLVVHKDGSKGGAGAFSVVWLLSLLPVLAWRLSRRAQGCRTAAVADLQIGQVPGVGIRTSSARLWQQEDAAAEWRGQALRGIPAPEQGLVHDLGIARGEACEVFGCWRCHAFGDERKEGERDGQAEGLRMARPPGDDPQRVCIEPGGLEKIVAAQDLECHAHVLTVRQLGGGDLTEQKTRQIAVLSVPHPRPRAAGANRAPRDPVRTRPAAP